MIYSVYYIIKTIESFLTFDHFELPISSLHHVLMSQLWLEES